jgi:mono/diheme cytochrome c family protein
MMRGLVSVSGWPLLRSARRAGILLLLLAMNGPTGVLRAEEPEAASPQEVRRSLDEAQALLDAGKPSKAREILVEAARQLQALSELDRMPSGVRALAEACQSLKDEIELEGIDVAGLEVPSFKTKPRKAGKTAAMKPKNPAEAPAFPGPRPVRPGGPKGVSFVGQIAPMLVSRCGGCHVTGRKGGFQIQSYAGLMRSNSVQPGAGDASRLVEVIESGDMPRGGGRVPPEELALLVRWINAGAAFDGPDPTAEFDQLAQGIPAGGAMPGRPAQPQPPSAPVALRPGDVSFAFEVAPILLKNCAGCHDEDDPEGRLSMTTFARLIRGGRSGPSLIAGKPADSTLVGKIKGSKGSEGQRMPIGRPPLPADAIAAIEKWIEQGARLDLLGPQDSLEAVAVQGRTRSLPHDELAKIRFDEAEKIWRRAIADEKPAKAVRGDVCVVANFPESRFAQVVEACEKATDASRKVLCGDDRPLLKGGVVIYAFAKAYDYSNFWQIVLSDERPKGLVGNAGRVGDVVYGAFVVPSPAAEDEAAADLTALAAEHVTMTALIARGMPEWFARGAGRRVASRAAPGSSLVKAWKHEATDGLRQVGSPAEFFSGHAGPAATAAIAGGFVGAIAVQDAKLRAVVEAVDGGALFEEAFGRVFQAPPQVLFEAWAAKQARGSGSGRR